jgi:hypothetical protein
VGAGSSLLGPSEVVAADLNGDGLLDLASVNSGGHDVTAFFQMSPGQFSPSPDVTVGGPAWTQFAFRLIAADLDDDGRVDLVTVSFALKKLAVFFQEAPGVFPVQPSQVLDIPASSGGPLALAAADLDGDHLLDLVSANDSPGSLTIFLQTGPRVFSTTPSATLGGPAVPIGFRDILAADLDGNGLLDLVALDGSASGPCMAFLQSAPGVFPASPSFTLAPPSLPNFQSVAAGDLNGDHLPDIVLVSSQTLDTIWIYFQSSPGRFPASPSLSLIDALPGRPISVTLADLNTDGQLDFVSAAQSHLSLYFAR